MQCFCKEILLSFITLISADYAYGNVQFLPLCHLDLVPYLVLALNQGNGEGVGMLQKFHVGGPIVILSSKSIIKSILAEITSTVG